jgi:hemolysin activation/secretion protein
MFKINLFTIACLGTLALQSVQAQSLPNASDVLRNIEQNKIDPNLQPKRTLKKPTPPATTDQGFARLKEIKVHSPLLQQELINFWASEINKPVPAQKLSEFKAFAWELFQSKGYLAYINTSAQATPEGSVLSVFITLPNIGKISVNTLDGHESEQLAAEVARRFQEVYKPGMTVDVQGIDNQLVAAAYDLPVDLDVSMRQVNRTEVDVVINLRKVEATPGVVLGGLAQVNNYGLGQFGRNQLLGTVRIAGFTPSSELTLTTQQSNSVGYYRADYEAPIQGSLMRWRVYASQVQSQANSVKGWTDETGLGLTRLLHTDRIGRWLSGAEISRRETRNWASSALTADRIDQQLRLKLRAESAKGWVDSFNNEVILSAGSMDLDRLASDKFDDSLNVAGNYQKLEMNGGLSNILDAKGVYTGTFRWRTQIASKNLDSYNRISLGGLNGIRAYTTLDGVGDQGAQISLEVSRQIYANVWAGLFYDCGTVKNNHNPISNPENQGAYFLQGAGFQFGGSAYETNWNMSLARSFGQTPDQTPNSGVWTAVNTRVGSTRVNLSITRPF